MTRTKPANEMSLAEYEAAVRRDWSEEQLQTDIIRRAHEAGWRVAHFRGVRQQRRDGTVHYSTPVGADGAGWPDLFLVRHARAMAVELKAKTSVRPDQRVWLDDLDLAGVEAYVWTTRTPVADIDELLT